MLALWIGLGIITAGIAYRFGAGTPRVPVERVTQARHWLAGRLRSLAYRLDPTETTTVVHVSRKGEVQLPKLQPHFLGLNNVPYSIGDDRGYIEVGKVVTLSQQAAEILVGNGNVRPMHEWETLEWLQRQQIPSLKVVSASGQR